MCRNFQCGYVHGNTSGNNNRQAPPTPNSVGIMNINIWILISTNHHRIHIHTPVDQLIIQSTRPTPGCSQQQRIITSLAQLANYSGPDFGHRSGSVHGPPGAQSALYGPPGICPSPSQVSSRSSVGQNPHATNSTPTGPYRASAMNVQTNLSDQATSLPQVFSNMTFKDQGESEWYIYT